MTLTEALQVLSGLTRHEIQRQAQAAESPLLRSVCRWQLETPTRMAELARVCGHYARAGRVTSREFGLAARCLRALEMGDRTLTDLSVDVDASKAHVKTVICRLRRQGHPIQSLERYAEGAQQLTYRLARHAAAA